jgi:hypothetical protein
MVIIFIILSVALKGLKEKLMFMFFSLQLVVTITVFEIIYPANVETFIGYTRAVIDAEYISPENMIGYFWPGETIDTLVFSKASSDPLKGNL